MSAIIDFLSGIGDFFTMIGTVITSHFDNLVSIFHFAQEFTSDLPGYLLWLPDDSFSVISMGMCVAVIYLIIGR